MIEVGEYVRNEDGYIQKINSFDKQTNIFKDENGDLRIWEGEDIYGNEYSSLIVKHSKNIIDLIEVGDIVEDNKQIYKINNIEMLDRFKNGDKIISILTKEQYNANSYRLEE